MKSIRRKGANRSLRAALTLLLLIAATSCFAATQQFLTNGGFENIQAGQELGWTPYGHGFSIDNTVAHGGQYSISCAGPGPSANAGAYQTIDLNQTTPTALIVGGFSQASSVDGSASANYSVYVNAYYTDGTALYGNIVPFDTGTHAWQYKQVIVSPTKPIAILVVYAMFRNHVGNAWFDDFSVSTVPPASEFDSQSIAPPQLPSGETWGWFARDDATQSPIELLSAGSGAVGTGVQALGLQVSNLSSPSTGAVVSAEVADTTGKTREVTIYYVEQDSLTNPVWWNDIRNSVPVATGDSTYQQQVGLGETGKDSIYPFGCVTGTGAGRAVGVSPLIGPRIARIGFNSSSQMFYVAFDVVLTGSNEVNSDGAGHGNATVSVARYNVDPSWGFRSAAAQYYTLFPQVYTRRATEEGIWCPIVSPATVTNEQDFGFMFHEGANSVASDHTSGILSFRYTGEPGTSYLTYPTTYLQSYSGVLAGLDSEIQSTDPATQLLGLCVEDSGTLDVNGNYNFNWIQSGWCNGVQWIVNPNPNLPSTPTNPTKASTLYTTAMANQMYGATNAQDGEYLDSMELNALTFDYSPTTLEYAITPPTFVTGTLAPIVPEWFSMYDFANFVSTDLHSRGKLLMGNEVFSQEYSLAPVFDILCKEVNWLPNGVYTPDTDATLNFRRTLSAQKPILLAMDADFSQFNAADVQSYMQRCLFYGVYPSMFSYDGSDDQYFTMPIYYNRDRPLFKKYVPIIKALSAAGWQPITDAVSVNNDVYVERYGTTYLTVMNSAQTSIVTNLQINLAALGLTKSGTTVTLVDSISGAVMQTLPIMPTVNFGMPLSPGQIRALRLTFH